MLIRRKIYPQTIGDALTTLFTLLIIPTVFYYEIYIVFPQFFNEFKLLSTLHYIFAAFIVFNICSNLMAVVLIDTSIVGHQLSTKRKSIWRFCSVCESPVPERSWHCDSCNICILKRDHHCMFTSCCIGHYNHRYFMVFIFYIFIATTYSTWFNAYFLAGTYSWSIKSVINFIFPLFFLLINFSRIQVYIFLSLIILLISVFSGVLLVYQCNLMIKGIVTHESYNSIEAKKYNFGLKNNIVHVLGRRWYFVWVSPFLQSPLPGDGITWKISD